MLYAKVLCSAIGDRNIRQVQHTTLSPQGIPISMSTILRVCLFFFLGGSAVIQAQTITGTVHNETTGRASVGDEVVLIRLGEGMEEEAHTKTGADGAFTLNVVAPNAEHFVRVIHQGVNYDQTVNGTS